MSTSGLPSNQKTPQAHAVCTLTDTLLAFSLQGQWLGSHSWETRGSKGWSPEASTKRPGFFWSWPDFVLRSWANFCPKVWFCPRVSLHLAWPSQVSLIVRNLLANAGDVRVRRRFDPWVRKIPWRRAWQLTPVLPGESPWTEDPGGPQSIWSQKELDMTEAT